ncbi:MAG: hypothetical protein HYV41_00400, partial [Candidatus Magasanikbacteria bacterium]|nr:hypothetical protein [Candidatus Magasanikbacteria bacterium]
LAIDSPEARALKKEDENALRETRLVSSGDTFLDFVGGEIFIYKDEICIVTAEHDTFLALTISSPAIVHMFKVFFFSQWSILKSNI